MNELEIRTFNKNEFVDITDKVGDMHSMLQELLKNLSDLELLDYILKIKLLQKDVDTDQIKS
jgi:hypothetical protein